MNAYQAIERGKQEILEEVLAGRIPATVQSFSELHDYVDANEFGGLCEDWAFEEPFDGDRWIDLGNFVQGQLDAWIKDGGVSVDR